MIKTKRLTIRPFRLDDWRFIVELLNQPEFIANIGDKKVSNKVEAHEYLETGPLLCQKEHGYSLMAVQLHNGELVGMCGLLKRDYLDSPDLGYAISDNHYRQGYAFEACQAVLEYYGNHRPILAITSLANQASQSLLEKLGFIRQGIVKYNDTEENMLFDFNC
ncbi:GNAT family N-acetyltransferase [Thalassotalea sp. M1531]|uniref:GNAT family N-acetyltransferase n=1 Tax=Thalassotalea algicola TaxID=2716224 RepID=A0A7Y0Q9J5_9GAMM|nr:GNAT family N-acetyltransferase [Thalassotalea algicola]NMP33275.1 GNAT family N-acetyltransferase [Thalassotalea algicola]